MRQSSHHTLIKSVIGILAFSAFISTSVTCDGNEEGLASFAVRDSNTTQPPAAQFGNAAVPETRRPRPGIRERRRAVATDFDGLLEPRFGASLYVSVRLWPRS